MSGNKPMLVIAEALQAVGQRIASACRLAGRDPASVRLLAVSKGFPAEAVAAAHTAGQIEFGENYVQEAVAKIAALRGRELVWHFIGPLQSNKTADVAQHFDWVHSVDRLKIAQRLSEQRPSMGAVLNVCVQVNISGEASKSGCAPDEALALCRAVAGLPRLRLRGLMAIPAPAVQSDPRPAYRALRELFERIRAQGIEIDTLSAGMSDDLEAAIAEGATRVRVGTAIFGARSRR
jgi:pyridoxal phosphate enzyme (YggS family)